MASDKRDAVSACVRALVETVLRDALLERACVATRDGAGKLQLQALQNATCRAARKVPRATHLALRLRSHRHLGQRAACAPATSHPLLSSPLNSLAHSQHLGRRVNGAAWIDRARGASVLTTERDARHAALQTRRRIKLVDGAQR